MKPLHIARALALAALALVALPASAAAQYDYAQNQHLEIQNRSSEPVTVRVLHSDGELQKQETVKPGETHRFKFEWCATCCGNDKQRTFEVKTGSTLRATGALYMSTKKFRVGPGADEPTSCYEHNEMTVKDENEADPWTFSTDYENGHLTAVLIVRNAT